MTELNIWIESFNNRLDQTERRISVPEDRSFGIIQPEEQKEKRMSKSEEHLYNLWDIIKKTMYTLWETIYTWWEF